MYNETRVTKIVLDLTRSINNHEWQSTEELDNRIRDIGSILWDLYDKSQWLSNISDEERNALYDILDMFSRYDFITKESEENE